MKNQILAGVIAIPILLGIGVVILVTREPSIQGCLVNGANGLAITTDETTWRLMGETSALRPGEMVKVKGKKRKKGSEHAFIVTQLKKDRGACGTSAHP